MLKQIEKEKQHIARCESSLALEKLKKRKAETRRKIELGGLVVKAGIDGFGKDVILGALDYTLKLLDSDDSYLRLFKLSGENLFLTK